MGLMAKFELLMVNVIREFSPLSGSLAEILTRKLPRGEASEISALWKKDYHVLIFNPTNFKRKIVAKIVGAQHLCPPVYLSTQYWCVIVYI